MFFGPPPAKSFRNPPVLDIKVDDNLSSAFQTNRVREASLPITPQPQAVRRAGSAFAASCGAIFRTLFPATEPSAEVERALASAREEALFLLQEQEFDEEQGREAQGSSHKNEVVFVTQSYPVFLLNSSSTFLLKF